MAFVCDRQKTNIGVIVIVSIEMPSLSVQANQIRQAISGSSVTIVNPPADSDPRTLQSGRVAHLVLLKSTHVMEPFRWGYLDSQSQTETMFVQGEGQQYGCRGILVAECLEMDNSANEIGNIVRFRKRSGLINLAVVWRPKTANWPASFAVMLCNANQSFKDLVEYQPVVLEDHQCVDFLNPQKSVAVLQTAKNCDDLVVELVGEVRSGRLDPFEDCATDPRHSHAVPYKSLQGDVII